MRRHCPALLVLLALALAGCGAGGGVVTPQATALPPGPAPQMLVAVPSRYPDASVGAGTDGWVLDKIETADTGNAVVFTLRLIPPKDETSVPATDAWFERDSRTYIIALRGLRGTNVVLRPNDVMPVATPPLTGYYALLTRDDTTLALAVTTARPVQVWSLSMGTGPGVVQLTVEKR